MPPRQDPARLQAFELYKQHNGEIKLKDIAEQLDKGEGTIRGWKNKDKWDTQLFGTERSATSGTGAKKRNVTKSTQGGTNTSNNTKYAKVVDTVKKKKRKSSQKGIKNPKKANRTSFKKGNPAAMKHGLFSKYIPDELIEDFDKLDDNFLAADIIWNQIKIQYMAILRAQQIMYVKSKDDMTKELKKVKYGMPVEGEEDAAAVNMPVIEEEYEIQFAWDKHAAFMTAQSRAMNELRNLIDHFETMADEYDERRLKLKGMKLDIEKKKIDIDKAKDDSSGENEININFIRKGDSPNKEEQQPEE